MHSVLWAVALNTHTGFLGVSQTLRMVGRNYGLRGLGYVFMILVPAAFPSILTGLKVGWAFAWRTLIAAELVFGVSSGQGGLGWFIFENRNSLDIPAVFAGLFTVIVIGLVVGKPGFPYPGTENGAAMGYVLTALFGSSAGRLVSSDRSSTGMVVPRRRAWCMDVAAAVRTGPA